MRRLLIVHNPYSSRHDDVEKEVLNPARQLSGYMIGKYRIAKVGIEENIKRLATVLREGDLVVVAGGDATAAIAVNAIIDSEKSVELAVLPYGNFNDLARTLGTSKLNEVLSPNTRVRKFYPLNITVDDKHWRYSACYVTMGMMAEAVKLYDQPAARRKLRTRLGRSVGSYLMIAGWYLKNRHKKVFIPEFSLNSIRQDSKISDYMAINGSSLARVMKGSGDYCKPQTFNSGTWRLAGLWRLFCFMMKSMFSQVPSNETKGDLIEFVRPATVELQAEGEPEIFKDIRKIEVRKAKQYLNVIVLE